MKPKLVPNPGRVLKHSATLRMIEMFLAITVLELVATLAPAVAAYLPFNPAWLLGAASICGSLAWVFRFLLQIKISGDRDADQ
ncbi:hypothetical protein G6K88_07775 [Agrobacterium rhizogenes]|uniref:hypothetical protein n=1 Tax=Rhizobium rhizogenes TaxID=359 RepID=UPI001571D813|nr:hypothetical protein [Rhizobium rhizogenes]NTF80858.1 hypothetical protein [Rhizobium rhizogenes]NTI01916.1 hypothetical protein [Rhizobium rhizogenes]NTI08719.1 hypothetical protein [Rhizobium rhizogenes]